MRRAIVYIDGFNLYHGLMEAGLQTSRWLDLVALSGSLLLPDQSLAGTRYFTTRVRGNPKKTARQGLFLDALMERGEIEIAYGHFLAKEMSCRNCSSRWTKNEEKKTDVNIAVSLLDDAYDDRFDVALVVSGDSDLAPPIVSVLNRFPEKRIVAAFPPRRQSSELRRVASAAIPISEAKIRASRLPNPVLLASGQRLLAPRGWLPLD